MIEWGQYPSEMTNKRLLFWIVFSLVLIPSPALQLWEAGTVSWISLGVGGFTSIVVFSESASNTWPGQRIDGW